MCASGKVIQNIICYTLQMGDLIFGQRTIKLQLLSGFCKLSVVYVVTLQPNHTFLTGCPVALPPPPSPHTHTHCF